MSNVPSSPPPPPLGPAPHGPPASVETAAKFMYVGAGLAIVGGVIAYFSASGEQARQQARQANDAGAGTGDAAAEAIAGTSVVLATVLSVCLWLWMAWKTRQGRHWARILSTVFFGLGALSVLAGLSSAETAPVSFLFDLVSALVGLGAVGYLWKQESNAYFRPAQQSPPDSPPESPS